MAVQMICPRCSGAMEEGLRFDYKLGELSDDYVIEGNEVVRERWQKTEDATGKFLGREYSGKRRIGPRLAIVSYRCVGCGYLESYAPLAKRDSPYASHRLTFDRQTEGFVNRHTVPFGRDG